MTTLKFRTFAYLEAETKTGSYLQCTSDKGYCELKNFL
jgi:hypothetical protein